jgi:hypothetical protein
MGNIEGENDHCVTRADASPDTPVEIQPMEPALQLEELEEGELTGSLSHATTHNS